MKYFFCVLLFCISISTYAGTELILIPLDSLVEGDSVRLWASPARAEEPLRGEYYYRWEVVSTENCSVMIEESERWHSVWADSDCRRNVVCTLTDGAESGRVTMRLEVYAARSVSSEKIYSGELGFSVVSRNSSDSELVLRTRKRQAVLLGLHYLETAQQPEGYWGEPRYYLDLELDDLVADIYGDYTVGATACALWAYGGHGFGLNVTKRNPFLNTVRRGFAYLAAGSPLEPYGCKNGEFDVLDVNKNGGYRVLGGRRNTENYTNPMCLAAFVSAGVPTEVIELTDGTRVTHAELVSDSFEFVIGQKPIGVSSTAWYYNGFEPNQGPDVSIAGWNYIALEAATQWGHTIPSYWFANTLDFLNASYIRKWDGNWNFYYGVLRDGLNTSSSINVSASAQLGIQLLRKHRFADSDFQSFASSLRTLGTVQMLTLEELVQWCCQLETYGHGYSNWNVVKALLEAGVTVWPDGKYVYDWRFGGYGPAQTRQVEGSQEEVSCYYPGLWEKLIDYQDKDGWWQVSDDWTSSTNLEHPDFETGMELLALSENVFHPEVLLEYAVEATIWVSEEYGKMYVPPRGMAKEQMEDGTWLLHGNYTLAEGGDGLDLGGAFIAPEGTAGCREDVILGGYVQWTDEYGVSYQVELDPLSVLRTDQKYGVEVKWGENRCLTKPISVTVRIDLPVSDKLGLGRQLEEVSGEGAFFSLETIGNWLDVVSLEGEDLAGKLQSCNGEGLWEEYEAGLQGKALRLKEESNSSYLLVYYNDEPVDLVVSISNGDKVLREVYRRQLALDEFGSRITQELWVNPDDLVVGDATCVAEIQRSGTRLVQGEDRTELYSGEAYPVFDRLACTGIVQQGEVVAIQSAVFSESGVATAVTGTVALEINGKLAQYQWNYDGSFRAGYSEREFYWDTTDIPAGTYVVTQNADMSNGQQLTTTKSVTVVDSIPEPEGGFDHPSYTFYRNNPATVGFWTRNFLAPSSARVCIVDEQGSETSVNVILQSIVENAVTGCVVLDEVLPGQADTLLLALLDSDSQKLLDTTVVTILEEPVGDDDDDDDDEPNPPAEEGDDDDDDDDPPPAEGDDDDDDDDDPPQQPPAEEGDDDDDDDDPQPPAEGDDDDDDDDPPQQPPAEEGDDDDDDDDPPPPAEEGDDDDDDDPPPPAEEGDDDDDPPPPAEEGDDDDDDDDDPNPPVGDDDDDDPPPPAEEGDDDDDDDDPPQQPPAEEGDDDDDDEPNPPAEGDDDDDDDDDPKPPVGDDDDDKKKNEEEENDVREDNVYINNRRVVMLADGENDAEVNREPEEAHAASNQDDHVKQEHAPIPPQVSVRESSGIVWQTTTVSGVKGARGRFGADAARRPPWYEFGRTARRQVLEDERKYAEVQLKAVFERVRTLYQGEWLNRLLMVGRMPETMVWQIIRTIIRAGGTVQNGVFLAP